MANLDFSTLLLSGALPPALATVPQFFYDACRGDFGSVQPSTVYRTIDGCGAYYAPAIFGSQPSGNFFWRPLTFKQPVALHVPKAGRVPVCYVACNMHGVPDTGVVPLLAYTDWQQSFDEAHGI